MNTFEDWLKTDIGKIFIENNIFFNKNKAEYMAKAEKPFTPKDARDLSYRINQKEIDQIRDAIKEESAKPNSTLMLYVRGMPGNAAQYFIQMGFDVEINMKAPMADRNIRTLTLDENLDIPPVMISWRAKQR